MVTTILFQGDFSSSQPVVINDLNHPLLFVFQGTVMCVPTIEVAIFNHATSRVKW